VPYEILFYVNGEASMKKLNCLLVCTVFFVTFIGPLCGKARGQSWLDFVHPTNPHINMTWPYIPISVPPLLQGPGDVTITRPVLVVLIEFSDVTHRPHHTDLFWEDLVFGNPRTGLRPSVAEIYRENTNGRLLLVPATAGDVHDGSPDGVVGWVASTQTAAELGDVHKKRAEGIIVADPWFDYHVYDTNNDGEITSDELIVLVILADNAPTGACCDQHIGHPQPTGCVNCAGGNTRTTDPAKVDVDQNTLWPKKVYQHIAGMGEMTHVAVVAHEIGHSSFGLGDLYPIDSGACQIYLEVQDGYVCKFCNNCNDDCSTATCTEDGLRARGDTSASTGTDITSCAINDANDVWYSYTPTVTGSVTISLCDSDNKFDTSPDTEFDTTLAVFDGCGGTELACNDDFDCNGDGDLNLQSQVEVWLSAGVTYFIRIAGYNGATGRYALDITGGGGDCGYAARKDFWYPPSPKWFSLMGYYWVDYVPHFDPWAKIHLGFVKPLVITHDGTYTLFDAETERNFSLQNTQPEAIIIYDPLRNDPYKEYFVLENRNHAQLNDQGLGLWLINEDVPSWPHGLDLRKGVRMKRRGGHWATMDQVLWDGINDTHGYDLTYASTPIDTDWTDGSASYIEIYDISSAGSQMTFKVVIPPIFVDLANSGVGNGSQANPYDSVSEAIAAVPEPPRTIRISGGSYDEPMVIDTPCTLRGWKNGSVIIGE